VPETRAYRISGSAELFPQHCQVSNLSNNVHLKALTKELETLTGVAAKTHKGRMLIKVLGKAIKAILNLPSMSDQRVDDTLCTVETQREQGDSAPTITIISDAPAIIKARDPTAKRNLINEKRMHRRITRHNTPGEVPAIQCCGTCVNPTGVRTRVSNTQVDQGQHQQITSDYHPPVQNAGWRDTSKCRID